LDGSVFKNQIRTEFQYRVFHTFLTWRQARDDVEELIKMRSLWLNKEDVLVSSKYVSN